MLNAHDLQSLQDELAGTAVLTVYLDTRITDPAMRDAWRPTLQRVLREARARITDDRERDAFDHAAAHLKEPRPTPGGTWRAPGWVAFVTADGIRHAADLPVAPGTGASWRDGPVIANYLRAFKQLRPVFVALVASTGARILRYAAGELEEVEELSASGEEAPRAGRPTAPAVHGMASAAPRGAVGSEAVSRRRSAAFDRLVTTLGERLAARAGHESWILVGGTHEWATIAGEALARQFAGRVHVSATLDAGDGRNEIIEEAKEAATQLRAARGLALVDQLIDRAGGHARAAAGIPAVQRALHARAVDLLLVTPRFIGATEHDVEDFVRAATASGADVEVPSGDAADHLDRAAEGIAARLRFPIDTRAAEAAAAP
jgi:hypothetical protein